MNKHILNTVLASIILAAVLVSCNDSSKTNNQNLVIIADSIQESSPLELYFYDYKMNVLDSIKLTKTGKIEIKRNWDEPQIVSLGSNNSKEIYYFLSEQGGIEIKLHIEDNLIDFKNIDIKYASQTENLKNFQHYKDSVTKYSELEKSLNKKWQALRKEYDYKIIPKEARATIDSAYIRFADEREAYFKNYVKKNNNLISQYMYLTRLRFYCNVGTLDTVFQETSEEYKATRYYKELQDKHEILKNVAIGAIAPEIICKDTAGNELALSSLRGKYVLLDFWASWCNPCRKENPWVKKAYDRFHKKGFDIYAVSLDFPGDKKKWTDAINKDKLTWNHVSNLKGWQDSIVQVYNVSGIPSPFLLDPEGKIVAKGYDLREESLIQTLEQYLDK